MQASCASKGSAPISDDDEPEKRRPLQPAQPLPQPLMLRPYPPPTKTNWSISDFYLGETIGEGLCGRVVHGVFKSGDRGSSGGGVAAAAAAAETGDDRDIGQHRAGAGAVRRRRRRPGTGAIALHPEMHVAVKVMDKCALIKSGRIRSVLRERRILSSFSAVPPSASSADPSLHGRGGGGGGSVVRLLMSFVDAHSMYMVTELCDGGSLTDLVGRRILGGDGDGDGGIGDVSAPPSQRAPAAYLQYVAAQLLRSLEYVHARGFVHRDVKPDNVLLKSDGTVRLIDLGSALDLREEGAEAAAAGVETDLVGTADYVAPEVLRGRTGRPHDDDNVGGDVATSAELSSPAIDLWSYGCLLYYLHTGRSPFQAASDHLAMVAVLAHADGTSPVQLATKCVPSDAIDVVRRLLVDRPEDRLGGRDAPCRVGCTGSFAGGQSGGTSEKGGGGTYASIRCHPYFSGVDWAGLGAGTVRPPAVPPVPGWVTRYEDGMCLLRDGDGLQNDLEWLS